MAPAAPTPAPPDGAIPPQNLEAEESVLGAMMISPLAITAAREVVDAADFYRESHATIYRAALALHDAGEPVDAITVTGELERRGALDSVGGRTRIVEIANLVPASANVRHYAELVRDMATLRGLIRAGGEIAQLGWNREGPVGDLVETARRLADDLLERGNLRGQLDIQTWAEFERDATEHMPLLVDDLWPENALGFIAAPPKKGKTWVGLDLAISVATGTPFLGRFTVEKPHPVILVALEGHKAAIRGRIGALARGRGLDPGKGSEDLANLHVLYKPAGINLTDPAWTRTIHDLADTVGARLLVVDVLRAAARLKENSNDDFSDLVRTLQPITLGGCAIALLHHFGKLTEVTRDRTPGERMSGAGAMYGAFDVGVFITGSEDHARRLRIEFETRDLPSPDLIGAYLDGTTTGPNGGFTFRDEAYWIEQDEAPDPTDLDASPADVKAWLEEQPGRAATQRDLAFAMEVHPRTIERRRMAYVRAGIIWTPARGSRPTIYSLREAPDPPAAEHAQQLDIRGAEAADSPVHDKDDTCRVEPCRPEKTPDLQGEGLEALRNTTQDDTPPVALEKPQDLQGFPQDDKDDIPKGMLPPAVAEEQPDLAGTPSTNGATAEPSAHDDDLFA